jgi:hypothetical protein
MIVDVAKQSSLAESSIAVGENLHAILRLNLSKFGYVGFPRRSVVVLSASNLECTVSTFFLSTTYYSELKSGTTRLSRGEQ